MRRQIVLGIFVMCAVLAPGKKAQALPMWSRKYEVSCNYCHTVAPSLNKTGEVFLANNFRFIGSEKEKNRPIPFALSAMATWEYAKPVSGPAEGPRFAELEIFSGDSFRVGPRPAYYGSYYFDALVAHGGGDGRTGDLEQAYAVLPFAGSRGQWAFAFGQSVPIMYQYNPSNELFDPAPFAFARGTGTFAPDTAVPGLRVDYFSGRGNNTRNGDYLTVLAPFNGHVNANSDSSWGGSDGLFVQGFRRWGPWSVGPMAWVNGERHIVGGTATFTAAKWRILGALTDNNSGLSGSSGVQFTLQPEYFFNQYLGVQLRLEKGNGGGDQDGLAVGATWYPLKQNYLRLAVEHRQITGDRQTLIRALGQF